MTPEQKPLDVGQDYERKFGFHVPERYVFKSEKGLTREIVERISEMKQEPAWMRAFRLGALDRFLKKPMPTWGNTELLNQIRFDNIHYYLKATDKSSKEWADVPEDIRRTYEKLGIPEAERKFLAGVTAQYESETVYHSIREDLQKQGVLFTDMDTAVREHPDIVQKYFATVIPPGDNKFAALNSAVWSGGSFIYVPKGVHVEIPLQAYFRINAENMGQFERTLIIADEGASVHYIEGCLPAGEQVSTGERWVNIEAVRLGDTVLNSDGEEAKVRAVRTRPFRGELITIQPLSRGNTFQLTPEHPVLAVPREEVRTPRAARRHWLGEVDSAKLRAATPRFIEAGKLRRGDFLVFPIPQVVRDNPSLSTPALRLLGYYLAEGSTFIHRTLQMPVVALAFGATERARIEEVKHLIHKVTGKRAMEIVHRKNHGITVLVYSKELRALCLEHCGKGAATKQLSSALMELPPAKQAHLLETYFLGDGSRYQRTHAMLRASTASRTLAQQLQELLARQGHYATISLRKGGNDTIRGRRITRKDQYILYHSPDRAMGEVRRTGNAFLVPIKTLERHRFEGPVFNIELDRAPNAYLARGFAVHNCTAPVYSTDSLHSAVVELITLPHAKIRYTTIQNWSKNVYNLVTKRAVAYEGATVEWIDGNLGCIRAGELVYTEEGPKPIEAVEPGTRVWSFDEPRQRWQLRPVVAVKDSGLQQVYKVVFSNGRTLHLTDNHPLLAVHHDASHPSKLGRYPLRWTPLQRLSAGDLVVFPTKLTTESAGHRFEQPRLRTGLTGRNQYGASYEVPSHARLSLPLPERADENACWMLGLWIADGDNAIAKSAHGGPRYGRVGQMLATLCGVQVSAVYTKEMTLDINRMGRAKTYVGHRLDLSRVSSLRPYVCQGFRAKMKEAKLTRHLQRPSGMRASNLPQEDVGIARITAIRKADVAPTYDLEVDGTCSFVVNGILVHNSKLTMKYPSIYLLGEHARGEVLSVAFAGKDQHQDAGSKIIHAAPHTSSTIVSKSISKDGGRTSYRGLVKVYKDAVGVKSHVRCDALLLDEQSRSDTYPTMEIDEEQVEIGHEASVSKVGEEQLFYLMSRGLKETEATTMIVNGFFEPFAKELPLEYAVELNRLIQLEMEGSVG